jgi:hypothetical protein
MVRSPSITSLDQMRDPSAQEYGNGLAHFVESVRTEDVHALQRALAELEICRAMV